jgi:mono/diheme cytochrome c family protein
MEPVVDRWIIKVLAASTCFVAMPAAWPQDGSADGGPLLAAAGCAVCHGPEGRGTAAAPPLVGGGLSAAEFAAAVRTPRGAMPGFNAAALPDERLASMYRYLSAQAPIAFPAGRAVIGADLFESTGCYSCHSNQGQGGTQGPRVGPNPAPLGRFAWYLRHPTGNMPPYTVTVLPDQAVADLHAFLRERPPRPSAIPLLEP